MGIDYKEDKIILEKLILPDENILCIIQAKATWFCHLWMCLQPRGNENIDLQWLGSWHLVNWMIRTDSTS